MNTQKALVGILAGIAAGVALGILFAPSKGSNTRRKISRAGNDYMDDLKDKFNEFLEDLNEKFEAAKDEADDFIEKGKWKTQNLKKEIRNGINEKIA